MLEKLENEFEYTRQRDREIMQLRAEVERLNVQQQKQQQVKETTDKGQVVTNFG